jgi:hypothetical protein
MALSPDRTVIDEYEPLNYLLPGLSSTLHNGIATIPGHPGYLLRWFPRDIDFMDQSSEPDATLDLERTNVCNGAGKKYLSIISTRAETEFKALERMGITLPTLNIERITFLADASRVALRGMALYTIVRRYSGTELDPRDPVGHELLEPYAEYLLKSTRGTHVFLYDVARPQQHLLAEEYGGKPVLVDTEPRLATRSDECAKNGRSVLEHALIKLLDWAGCAKPTINRRVTIAANDILNSQKEKVHTTVS